MRRLPAYLTPGHLVSSHVFAPRSAYLVYGCPSRLPTVTPLPCVMRARVLPSVPPISPCETPAPCETPHRKMCPPTSRSRLLLYEMQTNKVPTPHFRPRRPCSHLRGARSDQDDQSADRAGPSNTGAHEVTARSHFMAPRTHKGIAPRTQGQRDPSASNSAYAIDRRSRCPGRMRTLGADRTIAFILADFVLDELRAAAPPEFVVHVLCFL